MIWKWSLFITSLQETFDLLQKFLLYKYNVLSSSANHWNRPLSWSHSLLATLLSSLSLPLPFLILFFFPISILTLLSILTSIPISFSHFLRMEESKWRKGQEQTNVLQLRRQLKDYFTCQVWTTLRNAVLFSQRLFPHWLPGATSCQRQTGNQWAMGLLSLSESSF